MGINVISCDMGIYVIIKVYKGNLLKMIEDFFWTSELYENQNFLIE